MANEPGRPTYVDDQYEVWLEELRPFLQQGKSFSRSIELSGLNSKRTTLYEKYKLKDWFSDKVEVFKQYLGETINDTFVTLINKINEKVKRGEELTDLETKQLLFGAEKHRSAQPFFVNRFETARGKSVEEIIGDLETQNDNIDDVVEHIEGIEIKDEQQIPATTPQQVVAPNPPIQDQGQEGANNNVPAQSDPNAVPQGN